MSHVPMLLSELLVYVMSGWSFWLLGAALSLTYLHGFPMAIQIAVPWQLDRHLFLVEGLDRH